MTPWQTLIRGLAALAIVVASLACGEEPNQLSGATDPGGDGAGPVSEGEGEGDAVEGEGEGGGDGSTPTEGEGEASPAASYAEPCQTNTDCGSRYCISSPSGFVCTRACAHEDDCPPLTPGTAMECRSSNNFGADAVSICVASGSSLCQPCIEASHCFGGSCVAGGQSGSFCGLDCALEGGGGDCPEGTTCSEWSPTGEALDPPQCLPSQLACDCDAEAAGEERPCVRTSEETGTGCFGVEVCDPERGWVGCDAAAPVPELCDGLDNDCNGAIDDGLPSTRECQVANDFGACEGVAVCRGEEGYVCQVRAPEEERCDLADNNCDGGVDEPFRDDEGLYRDAANCGVCGNDCEGRFDIAVSTECQLIDGRPQCVITECRRGFALAGLTVCLPLDSELCEACEIDEDCNSEVGDACLDYPGELRFCGRDCGEGSLFGPECPPGYLCDEDLGQCRLERGTCLCGPDDLFVRACSIPDPNEPGNHCIGSMLCERGESSECLPPEDACNGLDDDCDGEVDDGQIDPESGAYFTDAHCGRCHNDCAALFADPLFHAGGSCLGLEAIRAGEPPRCLLECEEGFRNVNGVLADGCECELLDAEVDAPDPQGIDANCDGIDGEIDRGIFVSPTGDDGNPGTLDAPLRHLAAAIDRAGGGRDHVYVAAGVYEESIQLRPGVSLFGGYSADYLVRDLRGNETALFGQAPDPEHPGTVTADRILGGQTVIAGFTIVGYDNNEPSGSSYAIHASNSDAALVIRNNVIRAGNGGNGLRGGRGETGSSAPDQAGLGAPPRTSQQRVCIQGGGNINAGGAAGTHECVGADGGRARSDGGPGGRADCPVYDQPEGAGEAGVNPPAAGEGGAGGYNQRLIEDFFGRCFCLIPTADNSTEVGVPGADGDPGAPGDPGAGCEGGAGRVADGQWVPGGLLGRGETGGRGHPGGGGGGGGAGSGVQRDFPLFSCDGFDEVLGGGGGGGGAGGCGGTAGTGGTAGGGSFGVLITFDAPPDALPVITDNRVERGFGGTAGDGGPGAEGGAGSLGKGAAALPEDEQLGLLACADPGGRGGDGGHGGAGGGGGGGCGGLAAAIYVAGHGGLGTAPIRLANNFPETGAGGEGGRGGPSLGDAGRRGADGDHVELASP